MKSQHSRQLSAATMVALAAALLVGCNKAPDVTPPAPATTVGTRVDDTVVTSRVKAALLADADIKSLDISVATVQGEVQLSGMVDTQRQIDQAGQVARNAEGSVSVKNDIRIKQ
jgi:hyperosmotically inducible protein